MRRIALLIISLPAWLTLAACHVETYQPDEWGLEPDTGAELDTGLPTIEVPTTCSPEAYEAGYDRGAATCTPTACTGTAPGWVWAHCDEGDDDCRDCEWGSYMDGCTDGTFDEECPDRSIG